MPNKFLVETALDIGIANLEKTRRTDAKKLYEEVKAAIGSETSTEIKDLYDRYIKLYEQSVASTTQKSGALSEEIKWKNLSDLKLAIKSGGANLKPQDIEGLNQFALTQYGRMNANGEASGMGDPETATILKEWFKIYETLRGRTTVESKENNLRSAFVAGLLAADKFPFDIRYKEGANSIGVRVESDKNKLSIGSRDFAFTSTELLIQRIWINKNTVYIGAIHADLKTGKRSDVGIEMSKQEFVDKYLDTILSGGTITLHQKPVKIAVTGDVVIMPVPPSQTPPPPTPAPQPTPSPAPVRPQPPTTQTPRPQGPTSPTPGAPTAPRTPEAPANGASLQKLSDAIINFRNTIKANADKVGITLTRESVIEASQKSINAAYAQVEALITALKGSELSPKDRALYDAYVLEVARYYADEHTIYTGIGSRNRYWKNYDRSLALTAGLLAEDFARWGIKIPAVPTESDIRSKIKSINPETAKKFDELFAKGYSWGDIMSNPKLRGAWDEVRDTVVGQYEKELQKVLSDTKDKFKAGKITFKEDTSGARQKAFELMIDIMGAAWNKLSAKTWDTTKDTGLIIGSALAGGVATVMTGGIATGLLLGAAVTTTGTVLSKGRYRDGWEGAQDTGFEFLMNGITFGAAGGIAKVGGKLVAGTASNLAKGGIIVAEGATGAALGASVEKTRAWYEGVGLTWTEALKNNFLFAFLPLGLQYKGAFKSQSEALAKRVVNNSHRAEVSGSTPAVKAEAQAIAQDVKILGPKVQAEQQAAVPVSSGTTGVKIGEKLAPAPGAPKAVVYKEGEFDLGPNYTVKIKDGEYTLTDKATGPQSGRPKPVAELEADLASRSTAVPDSIKVAGEPQVAGVVQPAKKPAETQTPLQPLSAVENARLDTVISKASKGLDHAESVTIGEYSITKVAGGKVQVTKGDTVNYILPKKEALARIKTELQASQEEARKALDQSVKSAIATMPKNKPFKLNHEGEAYTVTKAKDGDNFVMTDSRGNVIKGDLEAAVWNTNAEKALSAKVDKVIHDHGHEKAFMQIGPDTFAFKGWQDWNAARANYNPIKLPSKFARLASTLTLRELMQPLKTAGALKDALTTNGSVLGVGNNIAKAIVLRDTHPGWFSEDAAKALGGRALTLSAVAPFAYAWYHSDDQGYRRTTLSPEDGLKTGLFLYYGGAIWGTVLQHYFTDSQPLTWEYGSNNRGAQVPPKSASSEVDQPSNPPQTATGKL